MIRRTLEYRYGERGVLRPGDWFHAKGGPYFESSSGERIPIGEEGKMQFVALCEEHGGQWIEARCEGSTRIVLLKRGRVGRLPGIPLPPPQDSEAAGRAQVGSRAQGCTQATKASRPCSNYRMTHRDPKP